MRRIHRLLSLLILLAAAAALWKREEITRLMAVNALFSPDRIVQNFSNMGSMFLTRALSRGDAPVSALPPGPPMTLPEGAGDWIARRSITALVVLERGKIRHESYYLGTGPDDLRISWSTAKSVLAALFGTVLAEGRVTLDDPVVKHVPQLAGSAYDGARVRDVLTMSSGVAFDEDYQDFWSDINRMGRVLALGGTMDGFAAGLTDRAAPPGERMEYVSIDSHVIGMVIRGATGRDIPELLEERILGPLGLEAPPYFLTDGEGVSFVLGGLNMTTRDYARVGAMVAAEGHWNDRQIIPPGWAKAMTSRQAPGGAGYGFQWWLPADARPGEAFAHGIYGQYIWIDREKDIVIAVNAADRGFADPGVDAENIAMLRAIADAL